MDISFLYDYLYSKISSKIFTEDDIKRYINDVVSYLELNEYLLDIVFTDDRYANLAAYNFKYRTIKVAMTAIINEARMMINMLKDRNKMDLRINLFILETLIHEIHHVYHNYLISETKLPIAFIFSRQLEYFNSEDNPTIHAQYDANYSKLIFERDANISAIENILRILNKYIKDDELFAFYFDELKKYIITGYSVDGNEVLSPIEELYRNLFKEDIILVDNIDLYDRLKLGFQVTADEFEFFMNNSDEIILSKNNLHTI